MHNYFKFDKTLKGLARAAESDCEESFRQIERISAQNQQKMLAAFIENHASESHFSATTGYGYNDRGRELCDSICASAFGCQSAILSHHFASGTHTITVGLFGLLRPGDIILSATGRPYDTLLGVIGHERQVSGSLAEFGIGYEEIALKHDGNVDINETVSKVMSNKSIKMVYIQRSRGYSLRPSLSVDIISKICTAVKRVRSEIIVAVDNCYGEFCEIDEPVAHGVDIMFGSLIKNPGGGIAPSGGYIAGKRELVERCSYRLTSPGTGREIGSSLGHTRELLMGFYNAPHVTGQALKTAVFAARLFELMGYEVSPAYHQRRVDIITSIRLENPEKLIAFCRGVQAGSPIDSFAAPEPDSMPGYDCDIIMASGSFTSGSSIELSADAPLREPFAVWLQGGLHYESAKVGVLLAAQNVLDIT